MARTFEESKLFFIIGRGRSGTTLLRCVLNAHPRLAVAPEALFIMNLYREYAKVEHWDRGHLLSFYDDLWLEQRLNSWQLDKERLRGDLLACGTDARFADLCKVVYANFASRLGKDDVALLGDKNPIYCLLLPELISLFPDAKFIHTVRDYRDNILSYKEVKFDTNSTSALAYRWKKYNQEVLKASERHPQRFLLLRYEDLLTAPEYQLQRICRFLVVDFEPAMLDFYKAQPNALVWEWHRNLRKPLEKTHIALWKSRMREIDVLKSDYICHEISSLFGYERSDKQGSAALCALTLPGVVLGWTLTSLERLVFFLPTRWLAAAINSYRKLTGSLQRA